MLRAVQAHARLPGLVVELGLQEQRLLSKGNTSALHCRLLRGMILATRMTLLRVQYDCQGGGANGGCTSGFAQAKHPPACDWTSPPLNCELTNIHSR